MTESVDPIDAAFSDILRSLRLRSGLLSRARVHAPFAVGNGSIGQPVFHAIVAGACSIRLEAQPPAHALEPGDVAILTRGDAHVLFDAPGRVTRRFSELSHVHNSARIQLCQLEGPGPRTDVLCGHFALAHAGGDALFAQLPPLVVVRGGSSTVVAWLHETLARLDLEVERDLPGGQEVITRLVDLLVMDVIRRCLLDAQDSAPAWAGALRDPKIGRALAAIHREPARAWSASALAAMVGMSRSSFFARFTEVVGEPPASYVARWRMSVAADLMSHPDLSMGQLAERVGYGSEHAFGKVFKRVMGVPPGEYRRQLRTASA
ncbi:MAG: AraC family transcriptional regulator [Nannocystaceae bacterium]|nr:AraC family transcriptional regulator [Nannocystaceae bacterium]